MTFGDKESESARTHSTSEINAILDVFQKHGHTEIGWQDRDLVVETKLYPGPNARHTPEGLRKTLQASLTALRTDKVELFYLHAPDRTTPWEITFKAVDELHKEGKFNKACDTQPNKSSWEVAEIVTLCRHNGWIQPTVYQGIYNAIHRAVEPELFPALRKFGISFYAYNPLSGGFLTGRYKDAASQVEPGSRFDTSKGTSQSTNYRKRYWNDHNFQALSIIAEAAEKENLTISEVALRWMSHHSLMKREHHDAVIIGASKKEHLEQNLVDLEKGPLPESIVAAVDEAWRVVAPFVQKYWH
ncbi:Aldo/keto reductase [Serendipita vermifera]|nr:Aldo/keto reductase [Serendipita vermifera]